MYLSVVMRLELGGSGGSAEMVVELQSGGSTLIKNIMLLEDESGGGLVVAAMGWVLWLKWIKLQTYPYVTENYNLVRVKGRKV
ncbi:hypothetical protein HanPI659440_Chr14g0555291 [Helianthus annuus]|nr:hypothetical protein HanPI659440_Chr14g0555291 [Helianthus annuus]